MKAAAQRGSVGDCASCWLPVPGEQLLELAGRMLGDAGEHIREAGLWIDVVAVGGLNQV